MRQYINCYIDCCSEWFQRRSEKQKQWLWFVALWCFGLGSVMLLGFIIRGMMGID